MATKRPARPPRREATAGILAGVVLAFAAWVNAVVATPWFLHSTDGRLPHTVAVVIGVPPTPTLVPTPTPTPLPTDNCRASAAVVAANGFDPYPILARRRPDVLVYYFDEGWSPVTQCVAIYDNWLGHGPDGGPPATAAAFVRAHGWAPASPQPTPTPRAGCAGPPADVARLGFDPYALLAAHRLDVLQFYAQNPAPGGGRWDPATQCVAIFDDWLRHPDGGPPQTAARYVVAHGWAPPPPTATP